MSLTIFKIYYISLYRHYQKNRRILVFKLKKKKSISEGKLYFKCLLDVLPKEALAKNARVLMI